MKVQFQVCATVECVATVAVHSKVSIKYVLQVQLKLKFRLKLELKIM